LQKHVWVRFQAAFTFCLHIIVGLLQDAGFPWQPVCAGLSSITSLLLGNNQLQTLPACVAQLTGLVQLGLQNNQLHSIESAALEGMGKLEILQLQGNHLEQLPVTLGERV
jgi:Leucine-rich repeat (LRR) protein